MLFFFEITPQIINISFKNDCNLKIQPHNFDYVVILRLQSFLVLWGSDGVSMSKTSSMEFALIIWGSIIALFLTGAIFMKFINNVCLPFVYNHSYICTKIKQSHGNEKRHWKRELKRLYIAQIPFLGKPLVKMSRRRSRRKRRK